ncbi:MAG: SH3 domain-containing protein [Verrucomicrobiota bacterium]
MFSRGLTGICLLLILGLAACATGSGGSDRPYNAMITKDTPFLLDGPNQQTPPNGTFRRGTRVRILDRQGAMVQVEAIGGLTGYVSAGAVGPVDEGRQSWTDN